MAAPILRSSTAVVFWRANMLLALLLVGGCDSSSTARPSSQQTELSPEEKFETLIARFKRRYGIGATGEAGMRDAAQVANVRIVPTVTYVLHEPGVVSDSYQAEITVRTKVLFTVKPELPDEPEDPDAEPPADTSPEFELPVLGTRSDEFTETYDLVYQDGRWKLTSNTGDDSVRDALLYALAAPENRPHPAPANP